MIGERETRAIERILADGDDVLIRRKTRNNEIVDVVYRQKLHIEVSAVNIPKPSKGFEGRR